MTSRGASDSFTDSIEEISPYAMSTDVEDDVEQRGGKKVNRRSSFKKMSSFFKSEPKEPKEPKEPAPEPTVPQEESTSGSFFGRGYGKMKGLFKKEAKDDVPDSWAIEEPGQTPPSGYATVHQGTKPPGRMDKMKMSMRRVLAKPPPAPTVEKIDDDGLPVLVLNEEPEKEIVRMSTIITGFLVLCLITGIILAACGGINAHAKILGPCFIVLSLFGLCGKAFFTLWWEDDPLPWFQPYWEKVWVYVAPPEDPYGHEKKEPPPPSYVYPGPATGSDSEAYRMSSMTSPQVVGAYPGNYPTSMYAEPSYPRVSQVPSGAATPVIYDDTLDTRPRTTSHQSGTSASLSVSDRPSSRQSYASGQGYVNEAADTDNGLPGTAFSTFTS